MKMTDILPVETWLALERTLGQDFGLCGCAYDAEGRTFTGSRVEANPFCPELRANGGLAAICAAAHQTLAAKARETRAPVIDECDAGLCKICVPIIVDDTFVGVVGGCGCVMEGAEPDAFLVHKVTGLDQARLEELAVQVPVLSAARAQEAAAMLEARVAEAVAGFLATRGDKA